MCSTRYKKTKTKNPSIFDRVVGIGGLHNDILATFVLHVKAAEIHIMMIM